MKRRTPLRFKSLISIASLFVLAFGFSTQAFASDFRVGLAAGYGGTGLKGTVKLDGNNTEIQRSEAPGVLCIFVDRLMSDTFDLGFEHTRGFSLGPFSTGESFTGLAARWYLLGMAPSVAKEAEDGATLMVRRFAMFAGLSTGVAQATISRNDDRVPDVSGSGVYFGIRFGADYPLAPGYGLRPELVYSTTIYNTDPLPSTLIEFSLQLGLYFYL